MRKFLFLNSAQRFSDFTLLLLRVFVGLYLVFSVWPEITNSARMQEYGSLLAQFKFPAATITAPVLAYLQLAIGLGFVFGLFTRWAGIFCVAIFALTIAMMDRFHGMSGVFPSGCLVFIGLYLATYGAGRFSVDAVLRANELPRGNGGVRFKT
jgi:uncharacterized membrane protein YphA (DoxX/SURF4 family)